METAVLLHTHTLNTHGFRFPNVCWTWHFFVVRIPQTRLFSTSHSLHGSLLSISSLSPSLSPSLPFSLSLSSHPIQFLPHSGCLFTKFSFVVQIFYILTQTIPKRLYGHWDGCDACEMIAQFCLPFRFWEVVTQMHGIRIHIFSRVRVIIQTLISKCELCMCECVQCQWSFP